MWSVRVVDDGNGTILWDDIQYNFYEKTEKIDEKILMRLFLNIELAVYS